LISLKLINSGKSACIGKVMFADARVKQAPAPEIAGLSPFPDPILRPDRSSGYRIQVMHVNSKGFESATYCFGFSGIDPASIPGE
jgi:hypothetical protein